MKTNLIEITVSARTGCGKSEVVEVITNALKEFYGDSAQICGRATYGNQGAIEEAKHTKQTAKDKNTIFALYEQNVSGEINLHD